MKTIIKDFVFCLLSRTQALGYSFGLGIVASLFCWALTFYVARIAYTIAVPCPLEGSNDFYYKQQRETLYFWGGPWGD